MTKLPMACKACGKPLSQPKGSGRRRIYCSDACRNDAYVERRNAVRSATTSSETVEDVEDRMARDLIRTLRPQPAILDRWIEKGAKFDAIIDDPRVLARFQDELLVRIGTRSLFEDHRYQRALNQMIVIFFMVGRMTEGTYTLPTIAR